MDMPGTGVDSTFHVLTGLANGNTCGQLQIRANDGENSPAGPQSYRLKPVWVLSEYGVALTAAAGDRQVVLNWTNPGNPGVTKYQYTRRDTDGGAWSEWTDVPDSNASTTSHTITGLTNDTGYVFALRGVKGPGGTESVAYVNSVTATPSN